MNLKIYILFVSSVITVSIFFLFTSANPQNNVNQKTISLCKAVASIPAKAGFPTASSVCSGLTFTIKQISRMNEFEKKK
jgi:ABC-type anion transport system duplicated permease subunit